jgi:hypothetical protein
VRWRLPWQNHSLWEPRVHRRLLQWSEILYLQGWLGCHHRGLNPRRATVPPTGHDRGLHRGVPQGFRRRRGAQPPLSQNAWHRCFIHPCHNHVMVGEHSNHSGDDDDSTTASGGTPTSLLCDDTLIRKGNEHKPMVSHLALSRRWCNSRTS